VLAYDEGPVLLHRATGARLWSIPDATPYPSAAIVIPVLGSSHRVVVMIAGRLAVYDIVTRQLLWAHASNVSGLPAIRDGVVYVVRGATVEARRETDGVVLWTWAAPAGVTSLGGGMIVTDNLLFVASSTKVFAIDLATHAEVWSSPGMSVGSLALSAQQGILYVISSSRDKLTAIAVR
jgi:outer membrane protein assembly factor BamB